MRSLEARSRPRRSVVLLLVATVLTASPPALAQTSATPTPTPAAGYAPCTLFTTIDVHDGQVFAKSTVNPNDKGQEIRPGYAITFACAEEGVVTKIGEGITTAVLIGGIALGLATGLGLGVAAGTGAFGGGGGPSTASPSL